MPEWLLKNENYSPLPDKDTFVNKSILSVIRVLSRIRAQSGYVTDKFRVNAFFKVLFTLLLIVLLSLSRSSAFLLLVITYLLLLLSLMQAKEIIKILKISLFMTLFTVIILLPVAFSGSLYSITRIPAKVFATIVAVNLLSHSTRWDTIISSLKLFFIPNLFIFVLDITIKYIVLLGEISLEMLYALKLRSVGKNKDKYTSLGGVAGTLFIKSKEMAEDTFAAMECRGFTGEYHVYNKFQFRLADVIYILLNIGFVLAYIFLSRG